MYYVTMQITFLIPECERKERNLHCDVVHVTTKWVSRLVLGRFRLRPRVSRATVENSVVDLSPESSLGIPSSHPWESLGILSAHA